MCVSSSIVNRKSKIDTTGDNPLPSCQKRFFGSSEVYPDPLATLGSWWTGARTHPHTHTPTQTGPPAPTRRARAPFIPVWGARGSRDSGSRTLGKINTQIHTNIKKGRSTSHARPIPGTIPPYLALHFCTTIHDPRTSSPSSSTQADRTETPQGLKTRPPSRVFYSRRASRRV